MNFPHYNDLSLVFCAGLTRTKKKIMHTIIKADEVHKRPTHLNTKKGDCADKIYPNQRQYLQSYSMDTLNRCDTVEWKSSIIYRNFKKDVANFRTICPNNCL